MKKAKTPLDQFQVTRDRLKKTIGAENLTRREAIETEIDIVGADILITRIAPAEAVVRRIGSADTVATTRGELIDLERKTRAAIADCLTAKASLDIDAIVKKMKRKLATHVVRLMLDPGALAVPKSQEPEVIAETRTHGHVNLGEPKNQLHVPRPRRMRAESADDDHLVLILIDAIDPIRSNRVLQAPHLERHDETVVFLPTIVLEALAANVGPLRNKLPTTNAKQKGQNGEHERKLAQGVNPQDIERKRRARVKSLFVNKNQNQNQNQNQSLSRCMSPSRIDDIAARAGIAIPRDLDMKSLGNVLERNPSRPLPCLKRSSLPSRTRRVSWAVPHRHVRSL